jgi:polyisoprenoid-binding protein YceI
MATRFLLAALAALSLPVAAFASNYTVDYAKSSVQFSGTHAGNGFSGKFGEWNATIIFDAEKLDLSSIKATFKTESAKTGNAMYDGTLSQDDWFASKKHPDATFTSSSITKNDDGSYLAKGELSIRGISHPVDFTFTLSDLSKPTVQAKGSLTLDRLNYDLGKKSDATAEWVSKDISIELDITASKAQ